MSRRLKGLGQSSVQNLTELILDLLQNFHLYLLETNIGFFLAFRMVFLSDQFVNNEKNRLIVHHCDDFYYLMQIFFVSKNEVK